MPLELHSGRGKWAASLFWKLETDFNRDWSALQQFIGYDNRGAVGVFDSLVEIVASGGRVHSDLPFDSAA